MGEIIGEILFGIVSEVICEIPGLLLESIPDFIYGFGDSVSSTTHPAKHDLPAAENLSGNYITKPLSSDTNIFNKESK